MAEVEQKTLNILKWQIKIIERKKVGTSISNYKKRAPHKDLVEIYVDDPNYANTNKPYHLS